MKKYLSIMLGLGLLASSMQPAHAQSTTQISWQTGNVSLQAGQTQQVNIQLNTQGKQTTGTDVLFSFDPNSVEIVAVTFAAPQQYAHNFYSTDTTKSQVRLTGTFTDVSSSFSGSGSFATVTIRGKQAGSSALTFLCESGKTDDTNLLEKGTGTDLIACNTLTPLSITVTGTQAQQSTTTAPVIPANTTASCSPAPQAPTNLSVKGEPSALTLSWRSQGATSHTLLYGTKPGVYESGVANTGDKTTFKLTSLRPLTKYYVAVASVNSCGTSGFVNGEGSTLGGSPVAQAAGNDVPSLDTLAGPAEESTTATGDQIAVGQPTDQDATQGKTSPIVIGLAVIAALAVIGAAMVMIRSRRTDTIQPPVPPAI